VLVLPSGPTVVYVDVFVFELCVAFPSVEEALVELLPPEVLLAGLVLDEEVGPDVDVGGP
jgi:hypothetical protein